MENDIPKYEDLLAEVVGMSNEQLSDRVLNGGFIVAKGIAGDLSNLPQLATGWALKATRRTEYRSVSIVYIIPQNKDTGRVWKRGQYIIATRAGLTRAQAFRWVASKITIKHTLLEALCAAIIDPAKIDGYSAYDPDFTQDQYHVWAAEYSVTDHLGPRHRAILKDLLIEVLADQFPYVRA